MKKIIFLFSLLIIGCSEDDLFVTPDDSSPNIINTLSPEPFIIYPSSFQTHEFNAGYFSLHTTKLPDNGKLIVGVTYVDFNNDGYADIIGKDENNPTVVKLYTNDGNNNYTVSELITENKQNGMRSGMRKMITVDINNDGKLDILTGLAPDVENDPKGLFILENKGNIFYEHSILSGNDDWMHTISTADINNDGYVDVVPGGKDFVLMGNGDFTFEKKYLPNYIRRGTAITEELIDLNNDGYVDILIGHHLGMWDNWTDDEYKNSVTIHYGTGDENLFTRGYVLESNYYGTNVTLDFSVIDFDGDGDYDVFVNSNFDYGSKYVIQYHENVGYMNFVNKSNDVFENECNLVINHYDIDWIKFIDRDGDGKKELMIEGANWDKTNAEYNQPKFNGFKLNSNNKFERVILK